MKTLEEELLTHSVKRHCGEAEDYLHCCCSLTGRRRTSNEAAKHPLKKGVHNYDNHVPAHCEAGSVPAEIGHYGIFRPSDLSATTSRLHDFTTSRPNKRLVVYYSDHQHHVTLPRIAKGPRLRINKLFRSSLSYHANAFHFHHDVRS